MCPRPTFYLSIWSTLTSSPVASIRGVCVTGSWDLNPSPVQVPSAPSSTCSRLLISKLEPLVEVSSLAGSSSGGAKGSYTFHLIYTVPYAHWMIQSFLGLVMPDVTQDLSFSGSQPPPCPPRLMASLFIKNPGSEISQTWAGIPALPLTSCVTLG